MRWLLLFAPLVVQLALLYVSSSWLNKLALSLLGTKIYFLLMWPGVIVHELSHVIGCLVTNTRIRKVSLFAPHDEGRGKIILGYVQHDVPRNPFSAFVVSAAPFFGGTASLWGVMSLAVSGSVVAQGARFAFGGGTPFFTAAYGALTAVFLLAIAIVRSLDWHSWQAYVAVFALFSLSAHVAPSRHDMRYAMVGAGGIAVISVPFMYFGDRYLPDVASAAAARLSQGVSVVTAILGYGLASVVLALVVTYPLWLLSGIFRRRSRQA
jgi:hypothetical protein